MAEYKAIFNITLNRFSDVTDIEAKFLFEENLWAAIAFQVMKYQPSSLRDSQAAAQRARSIFKNAELFEHAKKKS